MKRRALVLTNESARHPFRQMLPPPVFEPEDPAPATMAKRPGEDMAFFLISYVSGLIIFMGMIL